MRERTSWRSKGIRALAAFFAAGALVSFASCVSLLTPHGPLEPMWRLNPRAREAFARWGSLSPILLAGVSIACAFSSAGLWRRRVWGYRLAVAMFIVNLVADLANVILGTEPRALFGVPIVAALLVYLGQPQTRSLFREGMGTPQ